MLQLDPVWFIVLSAIWLLLAAALDAYDLKHAARLRTSAACVIKASVLTFGVYLLIPYWTPTLPPSRLMLGLFFLLPLALLLLGRATYLAALASVLVERRVLIVGAGWAGRTIAQALLDHSASTYKVVGFIDDNPEKQGSVVELADTLDGARRATSTATRPRALAVLGDSRTLADLVARYHVATLVTAITHEMQADLVQTLTESLERGVQIVPMPALYEELTGRVPVEHIGNHWFVLMPVRSSSMGALYPFLKRLMDVVLASIGLCCLAVATPFIALAISLDSPGPIFYSQSRVGKSGRIFRVYKFRSMVADAERGGKAIWAQRSDRRVTRVGRILRATHVDEFPQFLNILKGEMSAVGPRPERPEFAFELQKQLPFYNLRHVVKPGMAGWGLVRQGYGASTEDALLKLQYDLYYIKHQSLWLDTVILLKTIVDTVTARGR